MIIFPGRLWGRKLIRPLRVLTPVFRVRRVPASQTNGDKLYQQGELEREMVNEVVGHVMDGTRSYNWWTNYMNDPIG